MNWTKVGVAWAAAGLIAFSAGPAMANQPGCMDALQVDYEAPLRALPPIPRVPLGRSLPFGPPHLELREAGERVLVGRGVSGFELFIDRQEIDRRIEGKLVVQLKLIRVNRRGRPLRTISMRRENVGPIAGRGFNGRPLRVDIPGRPGFYLLRMRFQERDGSALKLYEDYFRVVKPVVKVLLKTDVPTYAPGEEVSFWIENRGTRTVDPVGPEFEFERFEGEQWVRAPGSPRAFHKPRLGLLTDGQVGFCQSFSIPSEEPAGLYHFGKTVVI